MAKCEVAGDTRSREVALGPFHHVARKVLVRHQSLAVGVSEPLQDDLELRIARLAEQENLDRIRPPLDGHEVMQHLGLAPGPLVGEALDHLLEIRIERGPIDKDEAYRLLDEWARRRGIGR